MAKGENMEFKAFFTHDEYSYCQGEWHLLEIDELEMEHDISYLIPSDKAYSPMGTYGHFEKWHFEDWEEVWEEYDDGLHEAEWCQENSDWLIAIAPKQEWEKLFSAFQQCDFRRECCGACI